MNLKKSPGVGTTNPKELREAATRDAEYIAKQFALYDPDLAICCGSAIKGRVIDLLTKARYPDGKPQPIMKETSCGVEYYEHSPGKYTIDSYHPQDRGEGVTAYKKHHRLVDAVQEILKNSPFILNRDKFSGSATLR